MEFDANVPIYLQVIDSIKKKILLGEWKVGQKMPSTRELALMYEINPNTASRVYSEMELMGLTFTKRGLGTFLTEDEGLLVEIREQLIHTLVERFISGAKELGITKEELLGQLEGEWEHVGM